MPDREAGPGFGSTSNACPSNDRAGFPTLFSKHRNDRQSIHPHPLRAEEISFQKSRAVGVRFSTCRRSALPTAGE
jgi:hypothetical protein